MTHVTPSITNIPRNFSYELVRDAYAMEFRAPFSAHLNEQSLEKLTPAYRRRVSDCLARILRVRRGGRDMISNGLFETLGIPWSTGNLFKLDNLDREGVLAAKLAEAAARFAERNGEATRGEKVPDTHSEDKFARRASILPEETLATASRPRPIFLAQVLYRSASPYGKYALRQADAFIDGVHLWMQDGEDLMFLGRKRKPDAIADNHFGQWRRRYPVH